MSRDRYIGVVTPSGNTVVERVTMAILRDFENVTPLFSRTPVFGASDPFPTSYGLADMLNAAQLLAHAMPDVILWNGSKGAKIGVAHDHDYIERVETMTGIRATTSIVGLHEALRERGIRRVAVVSPYDAGYQRGLVEAVGAAGYTVVAERHAARTDNISFADIPAADIEAMVRDVAKARPEAILTLCTNFLAAPVIARLEPELGIPMFDSVSIGVWHALRVAGIDTAPGAAWGSVFR